MKSSILVLNRELYPVSSGIARVHQLRNKVFILCIVAFMIPMNAVFANQTSSASSSPDNLTHEYRFNNGLRLIVKEDHRAPTVAHMVWYKAGSMDEINGRTGVAHVLEHMMFKGTKKVKAGDFSRLVAAVGGRENAFTSQDYTAYFQQVEKSKLLDVIRLESDRMANLQFSDEEFQKEIQVVMEERRLRTDDNPSSLMYESLMATAFMESPYRHPIIGWMNDLENLKPGDARLWYQNWYAPNNAIVVISGDVNPQEVKQWVDETYGQLPSRELAERKPQLEPAQRGIKRVNIKAPADGAQITMGWKVPHLNPERMEEIEPYALELLAAVLDGYDNARLNRELVREKQVANSIDAGYDLISRGPQLFLIRASVAKDKTVTQLEAAIRASLQNIINQGISESELKRIQVRLLAKQIYKRDSIFAQAMEIGSSEIAGVSWRQLDTIQNRMQSITPQQIQAVAKKYLQDEGLTLVTLDPQARSNSKAEPQKSNLRSH